MNPYPPRFLALYHECDGPVVDLGCGPARPETVTMDRLTNVDLDVTGIPNGVAGDVGQDRGVPLPTATFDLALSAAVLEHVPTPLTHLQEAWRLLKMGGLLYVAAASMQPLHEVPGHFFGIYPDGLRRLLVASWFEVIDEGVEGRLVDMVPWLRLLAPGPDDVWEQVESGLAALYRPPDAGRVFATGCWAVARKIVP